MALSTKSRIEENSNSKPISDTTVNLVKLTTLSCVAQIVYSIFDKFSDKNPLTKDGSNKNFLLSVSIITTCLNGMILYNALTESRNNKNQAAGKIKKET